MAAILPLSSLARGSDVIVTGLLNPGSTLIAPATPIATSSLSVSASKPVAKTVQTSASVEASSQSKSADSTQSITVGSTLPASLSQNAQNTQVLTSSRETSTITALATPTLQHTQDLSSSRETSATPPLTKSIPLLTQASSSIPEASAYLAPTTPGPQHAQILNPSQESLTSHPTTSATAVVPSTSILSYAPKTVFADTTVLQTKTSASSASTESTPPTSTTSDAYTTTSISTITPPTTTLVTSTIPTTISSSITSDQATASAVPANSTQSGTDSNTIPTSGIIVASVMGFLALITILFLIFRYCPPLRRRWDARQQRRREARTYREAMEGMDAITEKLSSDGSIKEPATFAGQRFYAPSEPRDHFARPSPPQSTGLGLDSRLSLLRQHAPFQINPTERASQIGRAVTARPTM